MKRMIYLVLSCLLIFSLTSCTIIDRFKGDMSNLSFDDKHNLLYCGNSYYRIDDYFQVCTTTDDTIFDLGWHSQFPFFPNMHYFSFDEKNPIFIFCDNGESSVYNKGLYVRSDYEIQNKLFTIKKTGIEISFSSVMTKSDVAVSSIDYETYLSFQMCLKDDPRIQIDMSGPYKFNDDWYFIYSDQTYILSNELVNLLKDCSVITDL